MAGGDKVMAAGATDSGGAILTPLGQWGTGLR